MTAGDREVVATPRFESGRVVVRRCHSRSASPVSSGPVTFASSSWTSLRQTVRIDVQGDFIGSEFLDGFLYRVDDELYDLPAGTYESVVFDRSGDDATNYDIVPSGG